MAVKHIDPRERLAKFRGQFRTQIETAQALGLTQGQVSDMLRGRREIPEHILAKLGLKRVTVAA